MTPDTWLPTWTVVTADSVPVAVTVMVTSPRLTFSVLNCSFCFPVPRQESRAAARMMMVVVRLNLKPLRGYDPMLVALNAMLRARFSARGSPHGFVLQRSASSAAGTPKLDGGSRAERDVFRPEHLVRRNDHRQRVGDRSVERD